MKKGVKRVILAAVAILFLPLLLGAYFANVIVNIADNVKMGFRWSYRIWQVNWQDNGLSPASSSHIMQAVDHVYSAKSA